MANQGLTSLEEAIQSGGLQRLHDDLSFGKSLRDALGQLQKYEGVPDQLQKLTLVVNQIKYAVTIEQRRDLENRLSEIEKKANKLIGISSQEALVEVKLIFQRLSDKVNSLSETIEKCWSGVIQNEFVESRQLAEVLERLDETREYGRRMAQIAERGRNLSHLSPPDLDTFSSLRGEMKALHGELSAWDSDQVLLPFLQKVRNGTATLIDLDKKVYLQLKGKNALGLLKVSFN